MRALVLALLLAGCSTLQQAPLSPSQAEQMEKVCTDNPWLHYHSRIDADGNVYEIYCHATQDAPR